MRERWVHIGRLWSDGQSFMAVDAALRGAWHGFSNEDFETVIIDQVIAPGRQDASFPVGTGRAVLVGGDGAVRDDSWTEVFESETGIVAIVQASDLPSYPEVLARALAYPDADDLDGDTLTVTSGEIAIFSPGYDGTGPYSGTFASARPGPVPPVYRLPSYGQPHDPDGLLIPAPHPEYKRKIRWYTRLDEDNCFARWLLIPIKAND
jgi:hypothetical protein